MTKNLIILAAGSLALLVGCTESKIRTTTNPIASSTQRATYTTWALAPGNTLNLRDPSRNTPQVQSLIDAALTQEMGKLGLQQVPAEKAQLLVSYGAASRPKLDTMDLANPGDEFSSRVDGGRDPSIPSGHLEAEWEEAVLNVRLKDRRTGTLVYTGTAQGALMSEPFLAGSQKRINTAIEQVLRNFRK
jgi:hypothetical protein